MASFIREKAFDARNAKYKEVELYEYSDKERDAVRQPRKTRTRATLPKVKKLNDSYSRKYFRWLLFNNFGSGDYHVTLTYDNEHLAQGIDACKREFCNYVKRLKRLYDKHGRELRYLYVIEGKADGTRLHYHMIVSGGVPRDDIERLWRCGRWANCDRLRVDADGTLMALAKYLVKSQETRKKCERAWNGSRNLRRPDITVDDNKVSKRAMRKVQDAARCDDVAAVAARLYPRWRVIDYVIGQNPVTGRDFARLKMVKSE